MQDNLEQKIQSVGGDTIMGQMANFIDDANQNSLEKLNEAVEEAREQEAAANPNMAAAAMGATASYDEFMRAMRNKRPIKKDNKIGRNEPCPCGSGKKYKNCCLASGRYETYSR